MFLAGQEASATYYMVQGRLFYSQDTGRAGILARIEGADHNGESRMLALRDGPHSACALYR
eukprot:4873605-Amphidinium_carterae.1